MSLVDSYFHQSRYIYYSGPLADASTNSTGSWPEQIDSFEARQKYTDVFTLTVQKGVQKRKHIFLLIMCLLFLGSVELVPAQSPAQESSISQGSHVLVPGEFIQIKVFQEPDLDTAVRIPGDGHVSFPLIGEVALAGETVQQATRLIRDRLEARFLVNPQVSIAVVEPAKRLFTVLGQVQRPGTYRFPEQQQLDVLQVIGVAGGYTRLADPGRITVKRRIDGSEKIIRLDGKRLARGESGQPFSIVSGDVITVGERLF